MTRLQFRPRVGPFLWMPRTGAGSISKLFVFLIALGIVWPLQLLWYTLKAIVMLIIWLVEWMTRRAELSRMNHGRHRAS